jgi:hypothetical protein
MPTLSCQNTLSSECRPGQGGGEEKGEGRTLYNKVLMQVIAKVLMQVIADHSKHQILNQVINHD